MNITEITPVSLAVLAGVLVGTVFYGGLWWTVRFGLRSKRPALLFMISWLVRFGFGLLCFYLVGVGHLDRFAACLIGFMASRLLIGRALRFPKTRKASDALKS